MFMKSKIKKIFKEFNKLNKDSNIVIELGKIEHAYVIYFTRGFLSLPFYITPISLKVIDKDTVKLVYNKMKNNLEYGV